MKKPRKIKVVDESKALLLAIVDSSDDAIISKDLEGIITSWNRAAERILGYTGQEAIGQPISIIIPPERGAEEPRILKRIRRGERVEHFETVRLRKDGAPLHVSMTISPVRDESGTIIGASKILRDITERKKLERQAQEEHERLFVTLSSIGDAVIVTDVMARIEFLNPIAEALTGWKQEQAEGQPLETVFHIINEKTRQRAENPAARVFREGLVVGLANHTILISRDGTEHAIDDSASPIRRKDGTVAGVVLVFRDVTGSRAQAEVRARLAAIVESSDDAIIGKDLQGKITSWNKGAERIFGYSQQEALGRSISILIPPDRLSEESEILERLKCGERVDHFETVRITKDRRKISVSLTVSPIRDLEGSIIGASKIARDITEQKKSRELLESQARHLESLVQERTSRLQELVNELEGFSYSLSHDLRAPLRAMRGYAQTVLEDHSDRLDAEAKDFLGRIAAAGQRLDKMINDVLSYSRLASTEISLEPVDAEKLLRELIQQHPELQAPKAEIQLQTPLRPVLGHAGYLSQVFSNFLVNAVKFVARGVTPRVRVWTESRGNDVRVWFEDNGIGVQPEDRQKIFAIFQRACPASQYEGTGIGLAIARKAAERMGGHVGVESDGTHGSKFWVQVRAAD